MRWSRWRYLGVLGVGLVALGIFAFQQSREADAQFGPFDCQPVSTLLPIPISECEFHNLAVHDVNDIHIFFSGMVVKLSSDPAMHCKRFFLYAEFRVGAIPVATSYDCTFRGFVRGEGGPVPSFGSLNMVVAHISPGNPGPAHVLDWYWTLNGTPVTITPTATNTPTSTPTPAVIPTNTPTPPIG